MLLNRIITNLKGESCENAKKNVRTNTALTFEFLIIINHFANIGAFTFCFVKAISNTSVMDFT